MKGKEKTKEQLQNELAKLRKKIAELKESEIKHKEIEKTLQESEKKYRELVQNTNNIIFTRIDITGRITFFNEFAQKFFGYTEDEILGKNVVGTIVPEIDTSFRDLRAMIKDIIKNPERYTVNENENIRRNGERVWILWTNKGVFDKDGHISEILCIGSDITERKQAEEALRESQQEFASLFKSSPEALVYLDENGNIININPRFTELFGYTLDEVKGKNINDGMIHPPDRIEEGKNLDKTALSKGYFNYETVRKKKDGTCFPVSVSGSDIIIGGKIKGIIGTYIDITKRKKMEEELQKLAHYDILTNCCTRGYGLALLEQQIKIANRKKTPILLLYLDVDNFKDINDTYGHAEGDMVLKEVAALFKSTLRETDIICRLGGDEFLLIFPDSSLDNAPLIEERINKRLKELNENLNKPYRISFSTGLSAYDPANPLSIEKLIKIADEGMYKEKKEKKTGRL